MSALALLSASVHAHDAPPSLFIPCAQALATREFAPLRGVITDELRETAGCLRLDDRSFLLFSQPGGPGTPFHHCDLRATPPACTSEPLFSYAFEKKREFTGANGKRYMLWFNWQMKRGVYSDGYGIFSLVPKTVDPRGFAIYGLTGSELYRGEGDAPDPCRDLGDHVNEITGYELLDEGTPAVELRFMSRAVDCNSRKETVEVERFRPVHGKFQRMTD